MGVRLDDIYVYSSDTDFTPFDVGAYASSTTYVSGTAVVEAAQKVKASLAKVAARMLSTKEDELTFSEGTITAASGKSISIADVTTETMYGVEKEQISCHASFLTFESPPPFAAAFAKVEVDTDTGVVKLLDYACAVDLGVAMNPLLAEGQIQGGAVQGIGYALTEEMLVDENGRIRNADLMHYKIPSTLDLPGVRAVLVERPEPTGPFGAKSVAEIPTDCPAPAIGNAIFAATGVRIREIPFTPERVLRALKEAGEKT
jgi:CO/xanthine dehydrogenase Mo-binding subunit